MMKLVKFSLYCRKICIGCTGKASTKQTEPEGDINYEIYYMELAYAIVGAGKVDLKYIGQAVRKGSLEVLGMS